MTLALRPALAASVRSLGAFLLAAVLLAAPSLRAQDSPSSALLLSDEDPRTVGQREQRKFETFRRANLPDYRGNVPRGRDCQEQVGLICYWYDESAPAPAPEKRVVTEARERFLAVLDSLGTAHPSDPWIAGQRIRYKNEAGRHEDALKVAESCQAWGWWCDALKGFAFHALGRYADAESAYDRALGGMTQREQCRWRDLTPYLDDDTRREYLRSACGQPARAAFEARVWWLARTRYGLTGNDSRTEHFARLTYLEFLREAPSIFRDDFPDAEWELLQRFGWPVAWARGADRPVPFGANPADRLSVISQEATPAYRLIPPFEVLANPAMSDSTQWAVQRPPVVARYHPPYAKRLRMLEHQQALFRRGDTALVALAYDVSKVSGLDGAPLEAALVLTPGTAGSAPLPHRTVLANAPAKGTLTVRAPWGPLLMSAEVASESRSTLVRARYGVRPPFAVGTRVVLSDLLFYTPYDEFPTSVEEVLPHALATQKVRSAQKLGVYWEAYNTNPAGERMTVSLTVVPESEESGRLSRAARALRLARDAEPVSVTVEDMSARGTRTSSRALQLDISTLKPGDYLVQLEISVAGQYTIRADRRIVVVGP